MGTGGHPRQGVAKAAEPASDGGPRQRSRDESGGNGRRVPATAAQKKAIWAICKASGLDRKAVLAEQGVATEDQLSIKQASVMIEKLKSRQGGG